MTRRVTLTLNNSPKSLEYYNLENIKLDLFPPMKIIDNNPVIWFNEPKSTKIKTFLCVHTCM